MTYYVNILIILTTVIISIIAFRNQELQSKMLFNSVAIIKEREWWRVFSSGLIHSDYIHLGINMYVLYIFGDIVLKEFYIVFGASSQIVYLALYVLAIPFSCFLSLIKHRNNPHYNALGASGAVSAIVFASIIVYPQARLSLIFIPIGIPAPVFGLLFLIYCVVMSRRGKDNIGHDAHFMGAIFGIVFTLIVNPAFLKSFTHIIKMYFN